MRPSMITAAAVLLVGSLACLGGVAALFFTRSGAHPPSAFMGQSSLRARATCAAGTGGGDAAVIDARLHALGLSGEVTMSGSELVLTLHQIAGPEVVRALLVPHHLAMAEVLDDAIGADVALPPGVTSRPVGMDAARGFFASSPVALGTMATWAPAGSRLVIGCTMSMGATECEGAFVRTPPALSNEHVESAEVIVDELSGQPQISIALTPSGASAFQMLTRSLTRRRLAIVLDDRLMSAPVVMEEIPGGRATITLGEAGSLAAMEAEAQTIATALDVGSALGCAWELQSIETIQ